MRAYEVGLSKTFVILLPLVCATVAYVTGIALRPYLMRQWTTNETDHSYTSRIPHDDKIFEVEYLPPVKSGGRRVVETEIDETYFTAYGTSSSGKMLVEVQEFDVEEEGDDDEEDNEVDELDDSEAEKAFFQHLLVDIANVDKSALTSLQTLFKNEIQELVRLSGTKVLSFACQSIEAGGGKSCIGVHDGNHISYQTWPSMGWITLDVFRVSSNDVTSLIDEVSKLFGSMDKKVDIKWSYKKRGVTGLRNRNDDFVDIMFSKGLRKKKLVAKVQTDFQTVHVFDYIHFLRAQRLGDISEEAPERFILLDGVMQSRQFGEAAYHEALVHPAMFAHANPRRVAIIGGGEGATLREVLKHNTVDLVRMIEIDEVMVNVSKQTIPFWSDCSDLVGREASCFDDPRADVVFADAIAWFIDRYSDENDIKDEKFDVIIMDALDPDSVVEFSDILYGSDVFYRSLSNALGDSGIFVVQVGEEDHLEGIPYLRPTLRMEQLLKTVGFEAVKEYAEDSGGFGIWSFHLAFKNAASQTLWHATEAEVEMKIKNRAAQSVSGKLSPFRFYDGATMQRYQFASAVVQQVHCRREPTPAECEMIGTADQETNVISLAPNAANLLRTLSNVAGIPSLSSSFVHDKFLTKFFGLDALSLDLDQQFSSVGENETGDTVKRNFVELEHSFYYSPTLDRNYHIVSRSFA